MARQHVTTIRSDRATVHRSIYELESTVRSISKTIKERQLTEKERVELDNAVEKIKERLESAKLVLQSLRVEPPKIPLTASEEKEIIGLFSTGLYSKVSLALWYRVSISKVYQLLKRDS